jgi:hypothetical protein
LIYAGFRALNPFRQICCVETVTEGTWKGVNTADASLAYSAEAAEAADNTPTLVPTVDHDAAGYRVHPFSIELSQDRGSIVPELTGALSSGKDITGGGRSRRGRRKNAPRRPLRRPLPLPGHHGNRLNVLR